MDRPTYIKGDYTKSEKFEDGNRLALGTAGIGGLWGEVKETESIDTLLYALESGVDVIDTSPSYYNAEKYIGKALKEWEGPLPFLSTKVGRLKAKEPDEVYLDYTPEGLRRSVENSLELLGIDYIDLLFLHEPHLVPVENMDQILDTLREFQDEGIVGMLGIGGNPDEQFWPYVNSNNFQVASSFLKLDACSLEGMEYDIPRYRKEGIAVYAASSLHMGLLGTKFEEYVKTRPNSEWIQDTHVENAVKAKEIAEKNAMRLPDLALRYLFSVEEADRVVLGASNPEETKKSLRAWEEGKLPDEIFNDITESIMESVA